MKVVAKKQTKIILVISLILLLLIGLVVIFKDRIILFSKIKSFGKLDKYSHLIDHCEVEKKKGEVVLHCKGVLKNVQRTAEEECIKVEVLTNDDTDLREEDLCISSGGLDWEDPYGVDGAFFLVNVNLVYKQNKGLKFLVENIQLVTLNDTEITELLTKNQRLQEYKNKIIMNREGFIFKNNFKHHITEPVQDINTKIIDTTFYSFTLKEIDVIDNNLKLTFEGRITDEIYTVNFYTNKFFLITNNTMDMTLVGLNNYKKHLHIGGMYELTTSNTDANLLKSDVDKFCLDVDNSPQKEEILSIDMILKTPSIIFCTIRLNNLEDMYIPDVTEYINSVTREAKLEGERKVVNFDRLALLSLRRLQ